MTLQILVVEAEDLTTFSALESGSDNDTNDKKSIKSNYRSNHGTRKEPEDFESTLPDEVATDVQILPKEAVADIKTPREEAASDVQILPKEAASDIQILPKEAATNLKTPPKTPQKVVRINIKTPEKEAEMTIVQSTRMTQCCIRTPDTVV